MLSQEEKAFGIRCPKCSKQIGSSKEDKEYIKGKVYCKLCNEYFTFKEIMEMLEKTNGKKYIPSQYIPDGWEEKMFKQVIEEALTPNLLNKYDINQTAFELKFFIEGNIAMLMADIKPKNLFTSLLLRGYKISPQVITYNREDECEVYENDESIFVMKDGFLLQNAKKTTGFFGPDLLKNSIN